MRAMAVVDYAKPLELVDLPEPTLKPGYVILRILACGVCFSDYKTSKGLMPYSPTLSLPHVPGHEICGEVVEAGPETGWQSGDRVVAYHYWNCGHCAYCRKGLEHLCINLVGWSGFTTPGGFEEYLAVPADRLLRVPEGIAPEHAAPATCASGTAYRAVITRGRVQAGETVVVIGSGGVGLQAIQFAQLAGAHTLAVDIDARKLEMAKQFNVTGVALGEEEARTLVHELTDGIGADLIINTVGLPDAFRQAAGLIRRGGRIVGVGYSAGKYAQFEMASMVLDEVEILGTRYALRYEIERVLSLFAAGKIRAVVDEVLPLEDANEAFRRLETGQVVGRTVLRIGES
jgi:propanol-preferring alcohol dehydrogenase